MPTGFQGFWRFQRNFVFTSLELQFTVLRFVAFKPFSAYTYFETVEISKDTASVFVSASGAWKKLEVFVVSTPYSKCVFLCLPQYSPFSNWIGLSMLNDPIQEEPLSLSGNE